MALEAPEPSPCRCSVDVLVVFDWLRIAGKQVLRSNTVHGTGELLWNSKPGYSLPRWQFWESSLGNISDCLVYEKSAREATLASVQMIRTLLIDSAPPELQFQSGHRSGTCSTVSDVKVGVHQASKTTEFAKDANDAPVTIIGHVHAATLPKIHRGPF